MAQNNFLDVIDILNRDKIISTIIEEVIISTSQNGSATIALDGCWGSGKSYILQKLQPLLKQQMMVFTYNCWEHSYYSDPLFAILSALYENIYQYNEFKDAANKISTAFQRFMLFTNGVIENVSGADFSILTQANADPDIIKCQTTNAIIKKLRRQLAKMAKKKPIVILVDELDRCLPAYAISVLERIYLLCNNIPNIVVLMAMDKSQLDTSIKQIFGSININNYLKKFIDLTIPLDKGNVSKMIFSKYEYFSLFTIEDKYINKLMELINALFNDVDIRTQEKTLKKAHRIHSHIARARRHHLSLLAFELITTFISVQKEGIITPQDIRCFENVARISNPPPKNSSINFFNTLVSHNEIVPLTSPDNITKIILRDNSLDITLWLFFKVLNTKVEKLKEYYIIFDEKNYDDEVAVAKQFFDYLQTIK